MPGKYSFKINDLRGRWQKLGEQPFLSLQEQFDSVQVIHDELAAIEKIYAKQRGAWQQFKAAFGLGTLEEKQVWLLMRETKRELANLTAQELRVWYPDLGFPLNGLVRLFMGIASFTGLNVLQSIKSRVQTADSTKIKYAAFHLMGKRRFQGADVEGSIFSSTLQHIIDELTEFQDDFHLSKSDRQATTTVLEQLKRCKDYQDDFDLLSLLKRMEKGVSMNYLETSSTLHEQRYADIRYKIAKDMAALAEGESLLLPSGYLAKDGAHAALGLLTKNAGATFTYTQINTGSGALELESLLKQVYGWFTTTGNDYCLQSVPATLINDRFIRSITQSIANDYHSSYSAKNAMLKPFQEYANYFDTKHRHELQTNGTCANDCVVSYLSRRLPNGIFHCFSGYTNRRASQYLKSILKNPWDNLSFFTVVNSYQAVDGDGFLSRLLVGNHLFHALIESGDVEFETHRHHIEKQKQVQMTTVASIESELSDVEKEIETISCQKDKQALATAVSRLERSCQALRLDYCRLSGLSVSGNAAPTAPGFFSNTKRKQSWRTYQEQRKVWEAYKSLYEDNHNNPQFFLRATERLAELFVQRDACQQRKCEIQGLQGAFTALLA